MSPAASIQADFIALQCPQYGAAAAVAAGGSRSKANEEGVRLCCLCHRCMMALIEC